MNLLKRSSRALLSAAAIFPICSRASVCFIPHDCADTRRNWAFEVGVAYLTNNTISEISQGIFDISDGPEGGEVWMLAASRRIGTLEWDLWGWDFHQVVEIPLMLEIVDERGRDTFLDYNLSITLRWEEFPWNRWVKTTMATGIGLSYSNRVYQEDIDRHPGEDRSHLKFNWPLQMTLAHPDHPQHQLMLYVAHQSGGHIFDSGGVNSVGFGYRLAF